MSTLLASPIASHEEKLLACIHCGLCLEACPTYVITGDENDGPRGRLYLMRAVGEGRLPSSSPAFARHIDRCLGCRACEQVCPAGVEYGQLLEAARGELFRSGATRGFSYGLLRLVLRHVWLHPARLRFGFSLARIFRDSGAGRVLRKSGLARLLSQRLEFALALLESSRGGRLRKVDGHSGDRKETRERNTPRPITGANATMLFTGCVGAGLFGRVNEATTRVLAANDFAVQVPAGQECCGALHAHAGELDGARTLARRNIAAFEMVDATSDTPVVTNAGGCGAMLVSYEHLLAGDPEFAERARRFSARVRDVSQQLETVAIKRGAKGQEAVVTYDSSCHLLYGQHAGEAPLKTMQGVPGLQTRPLAGSERCCGGAGIYNLLEPELSRGVLAEKLREIKNTGAEILATGNPGCQMQIGAGALLAGMELTLCHPIELLDESYARAGMYEGQ
jgi:glycolate oxidase iron-sulfur subunit